MTINIGMLLYILLCIVIMFTGVRFLMSGGKMIATVIFAIGAILVFVFFGLRWFENAPTSPTYTGKWPPQINTCPDFLTYYNLNGKNICIDTLGVSTNPMGSGGQNGLKRWVFGTSPPADVTPDYYYDLTTTKTKPEEILGEYCNRCLEKGVTWEGICDGESCYKFTTPGPGPDAGGGGGACKTAGPDLPPTPSA